MSMSMHFMISLFLSMILLMVMFLLKTKSHLNSNSSSNIECGFNSLSEKKFKFSNQFFMISILFVIFDMELVAILPIPLFQKNTTMLTMMSIIIMILSFSILMEWLNGMIEWSKS